MGKIRPLARKDPFAAVDLAHLAVTIALHVKEEDYGEERVHDFRGAAYSLLGFAMRNAGDFAGANSAFGEAGNEFKDGTGDPAEEAMLAVHISSLLLALGEFDAAIKLLNSAIRHFRRAGDSHSMGLTFIQQAIVYGQTSKPEQGLFLAEKGLSLLDLDKHPRAELSGRDAMAWCYNAIGDHQEALAIVYAYDYLYRRFEDEPAIWGKHEWLLGRIEAGRRDFEASIDLLDNAYEVFLKTFQYFDAVLVALDRIELLICMRRSMEAIRLANKLHPLLKRWGLRGDSLRLWELMTSSIEAGEFVVKKHAQTLTEHLRKNWIPRPTGADFRRSRQNS
jgi:tetratricopeptide (TPR) repeat protein